MSYSIMILIYDKCTMFGIWVAPWWWTTNSNGVIEQAMHDMKKSAHEKLFLKCAFILEFLIIVMWGA